MAGLTTYQRLQRINYPSNYVMPLGADLNTIVQSLLEQGTGTEGKSALDFGIVAEDIGTDPSTLKDQRAPIQSAFDWSSANRQPVFFPVGKFGHYGSLYVRSDMAIVGPPNGELVCKFIQLDKTYPDCWTVEDPVVGVGAVTIMNLNIDSDWDMRVNGGNIWNYNSANCTQRGLYLTAPDNGSEGNNAAHLSDTHNHIFNIRISKIQGTGLVTEGRGEMTFQRIWLSTCATWGANFGSFDNWVDTVTCEITGVGGWNQSNGNARLSNIKCWFIGYNKNVESTGHGIGFQISGSSTRNIVGTNITTQDTWGPGFKAQGTGNVIYGGSDMVGSLRQQFGQGPPVAGSQPLIELNDCTYSSFYLSLASRIVLTTKASLCAVNASSTTGNTVVIDIDYSNNSYNKTTPVTVAAGNITAKRYNQVITPAGRVFLGNVSATDLADAGHDINSQPMKGPGTERFDSTNVRTVVASGDTTTAPWYAGGAAVITPS